jgi:flagellar FliJ protein
MAAFRFRLQPALDLRVRQEDEARAALARAESARRTAERQRDEASEALQQAMARSREAEARSGDMTERLWYRNWIVAQRHDVQRRQQVLAGREAAVGQATAVAQDAHRKRRILERLKDRAVARFDVEQRREEQKGFDDLGTIRFTLAKRGDDL